GYVTDRSAAARAGILRGAEIFEYGGKPVAAAAAEVIPWSSPFSTAHTRSLQQFRYLTRGALGANVAVVWRNAGADEKQAAILVYGDERDSFYALSFSAGVESGAPPVTYRVIPGADLPAGGVPFASAKFGAQIDARQTGIGYIKISDLADDLNLTVRLFARAVSLFRDEEVPAIIVDLRQNSGGSPMGAGLAAYFTKDEVELSRSYYYSERTGKFETYGPPATIEPDATLHYPGRLVVLVGPACASACEDMAWVLRQLPQTIVLGQFPTAGMMGEVGRGQYLLPADIQLQIPTGLDRDMQGEIVIEGVGVVPDLRVPVDMVSVLSGKDVVLDGALGALTQQPRLRRALDVSDMLQAQTPSGGSESGGTQILLPGAAPIDIDSGKLGSVWWQRLADAQATAVLREGQSESVAVQLRDKDGEVLWAYGWCAADDATLAAAWEQIRARFFVEGLEVSAANLFTAEHAVDGGICRANFAALGNFPGGTHDLSVEVNFAGPVRAGQRIHAAGLRTYTHMVTAPYISSN
ncbi:MAG: S41 family peptidase, partial [Chloroflexi bacterium]|nr:S41 family peptidase [Chloroflexota bacterium]